jgi:hypothetical protein
MTTAAKSWLWNFEDLIAYKIDYSAVDEKPEALPKCLKRMVGERGFEPPTPGPEPDSNHC